MFPNVLTLPYYLGYVMKSALQIASVIRMPGHNFTLCHVLFGITIISNLSAWLMFHVLLVPSGQMKPNDCIRNTTAVCSNVQNVVLDSLI